VQTKKYTAQRSRLAGSGVAYVLDELKMRQLQNQNE
jgi:hypothetical protein